MDLNLFDYSVEEIEAKILDVEKNKNDFIADLTEACITIQMLKLTNYDEYTIHKITTDLNHRIRILSDAIEQCNVLISIYKEYIETTLSYFNYGKPHEVYEKDAKILSIFKKEKGE